MFKILSTYICWKKYIKCIIWRVAVCLSYIKDARFLKVKRHYIWLSSFKACSYNRKKCLWRSTCPSLHPSVRLSVCPLVTAQAPLKQSTLSFLSKIVNKSRNLVTIGQQYRLFYTKPRKFMTGNRHQSAVFECNGNGLLGQSRRYKHYANAPRFYVTGTLLVYI
jgi:hypothetical protein